MPNWCSNSATFTAPSTQAFDNFVAHMERHWAWDPQHEDIDEYRASEEPGGFCDYFVPEPDYNTTSVDPAHPDLHKDGEFTMPSWWDFRVSNWGTKWEIGTEPDQITFDREDLSFHIWFDSAWSPPTGIYEAATDQDWNVEANYFEAGMDFIGYYSSAEGENSYSIGTRNNTDAPDWLVEMYENDYEWIEEMTREHDAEELSREDFVEKWTEEFANEWDDINQKQENSK